MAKIKRTNNNL